MIKINYKGYVIEVERAEDVRAILGEPVEIRGEVTTNSKRSYVKSGKYSKSAYRYAAWENKEVEFIWVNQKLGSLALSKAKFLRDRHTPGAIKFMVAKVLHNNPNVQVSREIQALINRLHADNEASVESRFNATEQTAPATNTQ